MPAVLGSKRILERLQSLRDQRPVPCPDLEPRIYRFPALYPLGCTIEAPLILVPDLHAGASS